MGVWSLLFAIALSPQTTAPEVAIRTHSYTPPSAVLQAEANLVESEVTVRDASGRAVSGLTESDFEIFDNGVPQKIAAFSVVRSEGKTSSTAPSPRVSTFFFDDLHVGQPGPNGQFHLPFVKQAARQFAAKYLRPGDRISIATASGAGGAVRRPRISSP
jgi:VWFA-related protein